MVPAFDPTIRLIGEPGTDPGSRCALTSSLRGAEERLGGGVVYPITACIAAKVTNSASSRVLNNDDCSGQPPADPGSMSAIGRPLVDCSTPS